jgi:hypothetical protein
MRNWVLCRSPNIVRIMKSRRLQWAGHVARIWRQGMHTEVWKGNLLENFEGDWSIILRWILGCEDGMWMELAVDHV